MSSRPAQISWLLLAAAIILVAWLHLGLFLLTAFFGYLALQTFMFRRSKVLSVSLYFLAVVVIGAGLLYFASLAYRTFPKIAETSIPAMVEFAEKNGIDLPFTDYASLKSSALLEAREGIAIIGRYARIASFQSVLFLAGLVVALGIFLNPSWTGKRTADKRDSAAVNIYSQVTRELTIRFENLYDSFVRVMGAQIIISAINTALTGIYLLFAGFPFSPLLLGLAFLCGLIPIVGNLISNTVIVGVGFSISPKSGLVALAFLITIHKLEYFLNSKIIGRRIDTPMWLTLIGLLVGERLMGISGMILAPVLLHYIKFEASACSFRQDPPIPALADRSNTAASSRPGR
jgi:predicted PurR-regulated permease PerM